MSISLLSPYNSLLLRPNPNSSFRIPANRPIPFLRRYSTLRFSLSQNPTPQLTAPHTSNDSPELLRLSVGVIIFLGFSVGACSAAPTRLPPLTVQQDQKIQDDHYQGNNNDVEKLEDEKLKAEFETWKSKTYALSVPLRIVSLRGSVPPSWVKDFIQSQGRRVQIRSQFQGRLEDIFSDLSMSLSKGNVGPRSTMAADLVSVGDSWLNYAINKAIIEPIKGVENQDWFKSLSDKWKVYLRRNCAGELDPHGEIWAAPYRWGTMVIAYKKSKFQQHKLAPIEDWADLWRPELAGRISMVDSPREVVGAVLKYMGASYNTKNIDLQVAGGRNAVQQNLALLIKQVRLFDSIHYLKAFGVGDAWVAVGWSSDILPFAKRTSNVTVIVPKSGASLWADLWAIPAASRFKTNQIGGRVRGPSPLINQWIEFCLQAARALPFKQEVIPGASPYALESDLVQLPKELTKGKPRLDTNLIAGVPPPDILARCEFLEPLSEATVSDYQWLIATMQKPNPGLIYRIQHHVSSMIQTSWQMLHSKVA